MVRYCTDEDVYQVVESCLSEVGSVGGQVSGLLARHLEGKNADVVMTDLSAIEATAARDMLCKALYHRLFTWIVTSINDKIRVRYFMSICLNSFFY